MKCRYDLSKRCTVDCEKIRTCAWMADENRRKRLGVGAAPAGEGKHEKEKDNRYPDLCREYEGENS